MASALAHHDSVPARSARTRVLIGIATAVTVVVVASIVAVLAWSGVTLASDSTALARVTVQPLGGTIESVQAFGSGGQRLALAIHDGRLTPLERLTPGEQISVNVVVRRPGWLSWALGSARSEHLTLRAPVAQLSERWMTVPQGAAVNVSFEQPVSAVAYGSPGHLVEHTLSSPEKSFSLGVHASTVRTSGQGPGCSVVGGLEVPTAAFEGEEVGGTVVGDHLQAGAATAALRIPPPLVGRPGPRLHVHAEGRVKIGDVAGLACVSGMPPRDDAHGPIRSKRA